MHALSACPSHKTLGIVSLAEMATIDYVEIPAAATRLQASNASDNGDLRPAMKVVTSLPHPEKVPRSTAVAAPTVASPTKSGFNFQQALLSSTLHLPANAPATPRAAKGTPKLLSTRDPLSIPITTVNFRRFVSKVGPVFWLQDRMEEIVMWRKGWKYTAVWICAYTFLCTSEVSSSYACRSPIQRLLPQTMLPASTGRRLGGTSGYRAILARPLRSAASASSTTTSRPSTGLEFGLASERPGYPESYGCIVSAAAL